MYDGYGTAAYPFKSPVSLGVFFPVSGGHNQQDAWWKPSLSFKELDDFPSLEFFPTPATSLQRSPSFLAKLFPLRRQFQRGSRSPLLSPFPPPKPTSSRLRNSGLLKSQQPALCPSVAPNVRGLFTPLEVDGNFCGGEMTLLQEFSPRLLIDSLVPWTSPIRDCWKSSLLARFHDVSPSRHPPSLP